MSLEYAILGFLNYHPYTGYDLKKGFDNSVRHFWPADQSQIYRTLSNLAKQGWVEMKVVEQSDRPDRKVYSITSAGRDALLAWLAGPVPIAEPRSASLIQVFFAGQLSDEEILAKLETMADILRATLERFDQIPVLIEPYRQQIDSPRENFFWMLTLDNGMRTMRANLEWVENAIEHIKNGQLPKA
ncbi:MAG TPA: PadR family transcriptional regulator [Longilinea sp.]|nr:PadR family transcriptional regulator [Longilinea sp.]